jgi:hypothetical protein
MIQNIKKKLNFLKHYLKRHAVSSCNDMDVQKDLASLQMRTISSNRGSVPAI